MYESKDEMVSHPKHYIRGGMETIDVITAFTEGLEGIEAYDTGAILKYICRWKQKGGVQDLEKAMWYTQHLIDHVRAERPHTIKVTTETAEEAEAGRKYAGEVVWANENGALIKGTDGYWRVVEYGDESIAKETEVDDGKCTQRG